MAGFIFPQGSTQRNTCNSTALFTTLKNSAHRRKMLTAPLAHEEQYSGTLMGGCLEILYRILLN